MTTPRPMRIILHAGLHKSATTYVQSRWGRAYRGSGEVWYPTRSDEGATQGHHHLTWPLLRAFSVPTAPDLVGAHATRSARMGSLAAVVEEAEGRAVSWLVISSEDLDRIVPDDVPGLLAALRGHPVTLLLTITRPAHRWPANWQTLVRHGLAELPRDAAAIVEEHAALRPGRLAELLTLLPGEEQVVRVVSPDGPTGPDLARELAATVGLPDPGPADAPVSHHRTMGTTTEVLRQLNEADLVVGADRRSRRLLEETRSSRVPRAPGAPDRHGLTADAWRAAEGELAVLRDPRAGLRVVDPEGATEHWLDPELPAWFEELRTTDTIIEGLPAPPDVRELLWRVRQQRDGYAALLRAASREASSRQSEKDLRQRRRVRRLREENAALRARLAGD